MGQYPLKFCGFAWYLLQRLLKRLRVEQLSSHVLVARHVLNSISSLDPVGTFGFTCSMPPY